MFLCLSYCIISEKYRFILLLCFITLSYIILPHYIKKSLLLISHKFLYFSLFLHFIYFFISSMYIFLINYCFSVFLSSSVFILSLTPTLIFFFVSSLSQSVGISICDSFYFSFSFSFSLYYCQSLYDITRFYMMYCIIWYCIWQYDIMH